MKVKKHSLFPLGYDEISLVDEGAAGSADVLIMKRRVAAGKPKAAKLQPKKKKKGKGKSQENPCTDETNSTGAKDGKSKRSKNFEEKKHPRDEKGQMKETSKESKEKYGKDGTTKAKLEAECRRRRRGNKVKQAKTPNKLPTVKKGRSTITKTSMSTWDSDAHIRALLERKANGR